MSGLRVRWRIFPFLFGFGLLAYVQQKSITVAAQGMMPALGLSQQQIGWLMWAFVWGYTLFQMPGGVFGQRLGARRAFVVIGLGAFAATVAMPLLPEVFHGTGLFAGLALAQLSLGVSQAAIFPISAGVFEAWFPSNRWAFVQGLQTMGLALGAALTPPLIASTMASWGWQPALFWTSLPALVLIAGWGWYGRNTPREHPAVTLAELDEVTGADPAALQTAVDLKKILGLIGNRSVLLLAVSYTCMNYTFYLLSNWVFLYLVQERKFSLLEGGFLAMAPPLAAAVGAGIGGWLTGAACRRWGDRWGYRIVPMTALPAAAALLFIAVNAANPYVAVAVLALCFGCVELTEGAYWAGGMTLGRGDTMSVCGFMNTGGNLGGIIGIPIIAYFSGNHAWTTAFVIGAGFALASAAAWLGIAVAEPKGVELHAHAQLA